MGEAERAEGSGRGRRAAGMTEAEKWRLQQEARRAVATRGTPATAAGMRRAVATEAHAESRARERRAPPEGGSMPDVPHPAAQTRPPARQEAAGAEAPRRRRWWPWPRRR